MIYYVKGEFVIKSATQVVVDCAGVGYDVQISLNTSQILNHCPMVCSIHTT